MTFLAADVEGLRLASGSGNPWWQTLGGLLAVFGLLFLSLRLLARFNRAPRSGRAAVLAVWPLGPRREIQVLRLRDEVHYLYRHEGAMVELQRIPWSAYQAAPDRPADDAGTASRQAPWLAGVLGGGLGNALGSRLRGSRPHRS